MRTIVLLTKKENGHPDKTDNDCVYLAENPKTSQGFTQEWNKMGDIESGESRRDFHGQDCDRIHGGTMELEERVKVVTAEEAVVAFNKLRRDHANDKALPWVNVRLEDLFSFGVGSVTAPDVTLPGNEVSTLVPLALHSVSKHVSC
jgi:hypothetical protein